MKLLCFSVLKQEGEVVLPKFAAHMQYLLQFLTGLLSNLPFYSNAGALIFPMATHRHNPSCSHLFRAPQGLDTSFLCDSGDDERASYAPYAPVVSSSVIDPFPGGRQEVRGIHPDF